LNREQHITLVLVTHDLSIKHFSDRVLWMRDGKLQRVEIVAQTKRTEAYENLARDMEALRLRTGGQHGEGKGRLDKNNPWAHTQIRQVCWGENF
jgi:ABC-type methionine transport system ATPase subunit